MDAVICADEIGALGNAESVVHLDTCDVRVVEWRLKPGGSTPPRRHNCDFVRVSLTNGQLRTIGAQGEISLKITLGSSSLHTAPLEQAVINDSDACLAFIEIDLKHTVQRLISS